jgi:hypothetical protein
LKLLSISAELLVYEGVVHRQPLRLGIRLEGRGFIRVCEQRGDSVPIDDKPLAPADFGEGGRVVVEDITDCLDPDLADSEIGAVRRIDNEEGRPIGVALVRADAAPFCIWVAEDEFRWGDDPPWAAGSGGGARLGPAL